MTSLQKYLKEKSQLSNLSYWDYRGMPIEKFTPGGTVGKLKMDSQRYVYDRLLAAGYTPTQALGVLGNLHQESSTRHDIVNPQSGAYGLAQWLGDRKVKLHKRYGAKPSLEQLTDYLLEEMESNQFTGSWREKFKNAQTLNEAAYAFTAGFERPGKHEYHMDNRIRFAQEFANKHKIDMGVPYLPVDNVYEGDGYDRLMADSEAEWKDYAARNTRTNQPLNVTINVQPSTATVAPVAADYDPEAGRKAQQQQVIGMMLDWWNKPQDSFQYGGTVTVSDFADRLASM